MSLRVLHLTTEFPPVIYGGLGTAVGGWVKASARAGVSVAVQLVGGSLDPDQHATAYGSPKRAIHADDIACVPNDEGVVFFQSSSSDAIEVGVRAVREWRADIVHLHTAMLWYVASALQEITGKPVVYHVHSVDRAEYEIGEEPSPWLAHSQQEQAIALSERLIALTQSEAELLGQYYPETRRRVRVVGNGIDDTELAVAAAFGKPSRVTPTALYSGRLVERKGIRELLKAIPEVLDAMPDTLFVLAGGAPPLTGAEVAAQWLENEHTPFRQQIHFTGWLSPQDVANCYAAADILVVPSRYEPFGMVILEGMLYGLPIIAADVGGPAEILEHGRTGLLFPPRDVKALTAALLWLLKNPKERQRMGQTAAHDVRRKWLWDQQVPAMLEVYREILPIRVLGLP